MNRYAILDGSTVSNITPVAPGTPHPEGSIQAGQDTRIGDHYDPKSGEFSRPPAPLPEIPRSVTRRQGKRALDEMGFLDAVEAVVAAAPRPVQIDWADAGTFDRDSSVVIALAAALPLTEQQLDDLFTLAATFQ